jgi:CheY-like chemotaxis protein
MPRVLIVEDNEHLARIYEERLQREGFEVHLADNGIVGLNAAREVDPDVIILDLMIPKIDGYEVLSELKADASLASIPVVVLSNKGWDDDVRRAMALGAHNFYSKGLTPTSEVIRELRMICNVRKYLVIDGIPESEKEMTRIIRECGELSVPCRNSAEAVTRCEREDPDVILMSIDIVGYGISGVALVQRMRSHANTRHVPLILYGTGDPAVGMIRNDRATAWLQMPTTPEDLEKVVSECAGQPQGV